MRKIRVWRILLVFVMVFSLSSGHLYADTVSDLKKKQDEIKKNTEETKKKLEETKEEKSSVLLEIETIDEELGIVTEDLYVTTERLDSTTELLEQTEKELTEAEELRDKQYETLKKRIKFMYENGQTGYLEIVLKASSFGDFLSRIDNINRIMVYDKNILSKLKETEELITVKKDETEKQKQKLEVLAEEQTVRLYNLDETLKKKELMVERLNADEASFSQQITDLEKSDKEIENLIKKAQEEAARVAAAKRGVGSVQTSPYTGGKLGWPVPGRYNRSSGYYSRTSPISGRREFHTGIDIPAPTGTNIVSAEAGVVIFSGVKGGYGNTVIVDHGNGLSTLYGHNSKLVVSVGQSVSRGEVIAKAGSTGYSTGPHCHFEVRINGAHTNPNNYL